MLKEFAEFIVERTASGSAFVLGTTLQVGFRPQSAPDRCNVIIESVGGESFFDLPDRVDPIFQIISRSEMPGHLTTKGIWDARADAWEIYDALTGKAPGIIKSAQWAFPSGTYVADTIEAVAIPAYIGQDKQGRFEYSTNYIVRLRSV